jgi:hypothetical protein
MTTGRATARTGSLLETANSDVAALCLQLLVELSQRHVRVAVDGLSGIQRVGRSLEFLYAYDGYIYIIIYISLSLYVVYNLYPLYYKYIYIHIYIYLCEI